MIPPSNRPQRATEEQHGPILHIFAYDWQPLVKFRDADGHVFRYNPRKVLRCHECLDWRWASKLKIQAYYDYWRIQCADGCYGENRTLKGAQ